MTIEDDVLGTILVIVTIVLVFPFILMLLAVPMMGGWHMMDGTVNGWWGWSWPLLWILGAAIAVGIGYLLYRSIGTDSQEDPAIQELKEAYARGDLTDEEYERRREKLSE